MILSSTVLYKDIMILGIHPSVNDIAFLIFDVLLLILCSLIHYETRMSLSKSDKKYCEKAVRLVKIPERNCSVILNLAQSTK